MNCKTFHEGGLFVKVDSKYIYKRFMFIINSILIYLYLNKIYRGLGYREVPQTYGKTINLLKNNK